ncbi:MAG: carbohydrate porin [Sulfurimonas sp.]|nr:carbohydrate porin [Sulfurimonas sp.]
MKNKFLLLPLFLMTLLSHLIASPIEREHIQKMQHPNDTQLDGLSISAALTVDFLNNVSGGLNQDVTVLGNLDIAAELDTQKSGLWDNGVFFTYIIANINSNGYLTDIVGDMQTSSNIEAPEAIRVYEFWYEHKFNNVNTSLLVGLHDYNSEFNALEYAGIFINSSFGIEPDISQVTPSIFPVTSLVARLKIQPSDNSYILAAIYDGVPGDPDDEKATAIKFDEGDGIFASVEIGLTNAQAFDSDYYKIAIGSWLKTTKEEAYDGTVDTFNSGFFLIGEKKLYSENNSDNGLGAFFQLGIADEDRNQVSFYWGGGINYKGLFSKRSKDILGLAVASARNSDRYIGYIKSIGNNIDKTETAIELNYNARITSWLYIQPDIQYIIDPSMDSSVDNALIAGLRVVLEY